MRPGISCSARRISLRPQSARSRSATLYGGRAAFAAASNACIFSNRTVAILFLSSVCYSGKERRALRIGIDRQGTHARALESCVGQELHDLLFRKTEPHVAHLLLILVVMMRQHIDEQNLAARAADARDFRQRADRLRRVVEHEREQ